MRRLFLLCFTLFYSQGFAIWDSDEFEKQVSRRLSFCPASEKVSPERVRRILTKLETATVNLHEGVFSFSYGFSYGERPYTGSVRGRASNLLTFTQKASSAFAHAWIKLDEEAKREARLSRFCSARA